MIQKMKDKSEVEAGEFQNRSGMIDVFACGCGKTAVYLYTDGGVTPTMIGCSCGGQMFSQGNKVTQPSIMWYRPDNLNQLKELALQAYIHGSGKGDYDGRDKDDVLDMILNNYIEHFNNGGLFSAPLV